MQFCKINLFTLLVLISSGSFAQGTIAEDLILDDPEDMKSYREVLNKIANDIYSLRERRVDENGSSYKVYIEYFRAFYTDSTTKAPTIYFKNS